MQAAANFIRGAMGNCTPARSFFPQAAIGNGSRRAGHSRLHGGKQRNHSMRSKLLLGTAALLAGIGLASAQNMPGGAQPGGGQPGAGAQSQGAPSQSGPGQRAQQKEQTTGQISPRDQSAPGKSEALPGKNGQQDKAQPQRTQRDREQTTGQGQREQQGQGMSPTQREPSPGQAQSPQRQQSQPGQAAQPGQSQQGQASQSQSGGNVTLTTEQRTKIRQTVLTGGNVPRANNVNFSINVGTTVPTSVRVVEVPSTLIEIHPEWRGHMYFVVGEEIIIVDRNHRIIAVIQV